MVANSKAFDLLESMLHAIPSKRIKAEFALTHEFFQGETVGNHKTLPSALFKFRCMYRNDAECRR